MVLKTINCYGDILKIVQFDQEKRSAKLRVESATDFWHLEKIVEKGDLITARTLRTIFVQRGEERIKSKKKFVVLTVKVEKIEFQKHKNKLRFIGKIVEGPEEVQKGSFHAIEIGIGNMFTIEKKEWKEDQIKRLEKAKIKIKVLKDPRLVQEFLMHVNKGDGLAAYGFEQVKLAASMGAVKVVFIPEEKIRESEIEKLIEEIQNKRGEVNLVSKGYSVGKKFSKAYNIAAILRFPMS